MIVENNISVLAFRFSVWNNKSYKLFACGHTDDIFYADVNIYGLFIKSVNDMGDVSLTMSTLDRVRYAVDVQPFSIWKGLPQELVSSLFFIDLFES